MGLLVERTPCLQVSATTKSRLRLVAVRSLFECIEVMLLPPPAANGTRGPTRLMTGGAHTRLTCLLPAAALPAAMPPPAGLECVRALLALDTTKGVGGGVPALVQCARVPRPSHMDSPPHPDVTCTADLQAWLPTAYPAHLLRGGRGQDTTS